MKRFIEFLSSGLDGNGQCSVVEDQQPTPNPKSIARLTVTHSNVALQICAET